MEIEDIDLGMIQTFVNVDKSFLVVKGAVFSNLDPE